MISTSTFAFALALVVAVSVAAAWITWLRLTQELNSARSTTQQTLRHIVANIDAMKKTISELKRAAPFDLAEKVEGLSASVDRLRDTQRRFQGRFDAKMARDDSAQANETPEQTRERLRLKHGLPKLGGIAPKGE